MKRDTLKAFRSRARQTDALVAEGVAAVNKARDDAYRAAREAHRVAEASRKRFTRDDLLGATHVMVFGAVRKIARVNLKTVSLETGHSFVDRVPFDKITDVHTVGGAK